MQLQPAIVQRLVQIVLDLQFLVFQQRAMTTKHALLAGEYPAVASLFLGVVLGAVGPVQQIGGAFPGFAQGDAHAA
jgi:hypothetical protein